MSDHYFSYQTTMGFPAQDVFSWYMRPGALFRLMPPWRKTKLLFHEGGPDEEGSRVGIQVQFGGVWWKWVLQHRGIVPGKEFSDCQVKGPFAHYCHQHRVDPVDNQSCCVMDKITYRPPLNLPMPGIEAEFGKLFRWRHQILQGDLELISRYQTKPMRILLSGATGLIGRSMEALLGTAGHDTVRLVRNHGMVSRHAIHWDPVRGNFSKEDFEGFDAVIHLAGENIAAGRWTKKRKNRLFLSRCRDTWLLSQILSRSERPPKIVICASALGFYGNRGNEEVTEMSPKGEGFLADLCGKWEDATQAIQSRGSRVIHARFGVVLSAAGGMLQKSLLPFKLGLGGKLGPGDQMMSWIGIDDVIGALYHVLMTESIQGPINVTAPKPVTQAEFSCMLARKLGRPMLLSLPAWVLRSLLGEMADELLLSSSRVIPKKLMETGYVFRYPDLAQALEYVM